MRQPLHAALNPPNTLFLVLLMSPLMPLYDRYRTMPERQTHHAARRARLHAVATRRLAGPSPLVPAERTS